MIHRIRTVLAFTICALGVAILVSRSKVEAADAPPTFAYALKGEQVGSLAFELFDSGAARFGDRLERREGQASQTVRRQADGQQRCGCCGSGWNNIEVRAFW